MGHIELARWARLRADRAGERGFSRAPRRRARRRPARDAVPRDRGADRGGAGDEPHHVGERRHPRQRRDARRARRAAARTRRAATRRAARSARAACSSRSSSPTGCRRSLAAALLAGRRVLVTRRPHARAHRPGALHQQPQLRQDGLRRRAGGARGGRERSAGRGPCEPADAGGRDAHRRRERRRHARRRAARGRRHRCVHLDGGGGGLPPGARRRAEDQEDERHARSVHGAHRRRPRHRGGTPRAARSWSASPPRPRRSSRTRAPSS